MPYKLKISGLQFEGEIEGAQDWARSVTRDFNDRIFRTRPEYKFIGHKGLYSLLYNHISLNGVCEALEGRIYFNTGTDWDYEWKGDILPQDIEYDLLKRAADGQVLDASWSAKFNNSQDQKVFLKGQTSKRGNPILSATSELCDFFTPSTGTYDVTNRECYRVYDVFTYLVDYYSDGTVTFDSSFFTIGGDGDQYYITTGKEIRTGDQNANPEISFSELFDEMNKKCNLWIVIEGTQDAPILRIEPQSYVFQNQLLLTIADPETIIMKTDLDQLYTIIKVGSSEAEYNPSENANYPTPRFFSWREEEYNSVGDCEFENNVLDLVSRWRIDTNSFEIQIASIGQDEGTYDDDIFIVEIDSSSQNAYQYTTDYTASGTVPFIYNYNLTNEQVILSWLNGIPTEIAKEISSGVYARVSRVGNTVWGSGPPFTPFRVHFNDDSTSPNVDRDDVYDLAEFHFVSPLDSFYNHKGNVQAQVLTGASLGSTGTLKVMVWADSTRTTLLSETFASPVSIAPGGTTIVNFYYDLNVFMPSDAVSSISIDFTNTVFVIINTNSYCEFSTDVQNYLPTATEAPLIYSYEAAQFQLSRADFDTLDQGRGFVRILDTNGNKAYDVWAKDVKYNSTTGVVEVAEWIGTTPPIEVCWVLESKYWDDECYWLDNEEIVFPESDWFIFTVDTTVAAKTNNDQFELPLIGSANLTVDWGDGDIETGVTGTTVHTYSASGTYTIKIAGSWTRFGFLTTVEDNDKMQTIEQWGAIGWGSMLNAFADCQNLTANYTDTPNLVNCSQFQGAFNRCTNFNGDVGGFDMSNATTLVNMFFNCTSFNNGGSDSIKDWNFNSVSGNIDMAGCFYGCSSFDQPLTNWATNRVTNFSQFLYNCSSFNQPLAHFRFDICTTVFWMLRNCSLFDQNVGAWNMDTRPVGTYTSIMQGVTLSTANYDALLTGWTGWSGGAPTKTLPANRTGVNFGSSTYSLGSDADDARDYLINTLSWVIIDGGGV